MRLTLFSVQTVTLVSHGTCYNRNGHVHQCPSPAAWANPTNLGPNSSNSKIQGGEYDFRGQKPKKEGRLFDPIHPRPQKVAPNRGTGGRAEGSKKKIAEICGSHNDEFT